MIKSIPRHGLTAVLTFAEHQRFQNRLDFSFTSFYSRNMAFSASKTRQPSIRFRTLREKSQRTIPNARNGKYWDPIFSEIRECSDRAVYEDWSELRKDSEENSPCERELVTMLLGSLEVSNASWETKVLKKFLLQQGNEEPTAEDDHAWTWVDDRKISGERSRQYSGSFDAHGLQEILENSVRVVLMFYSKSN